MVIHVISTSVMTSPPYFTNYDTTYLQHFAVKMQEYGSGSELQYGARCAHMQRNIWKKEHDWLKRSWQALNGPITSRVLFEVWF